jgi:hypothetical protein
MKRDLYPESAHTADNAHVAIDAALASSGLPNRLMTAFDVAKFVGCHEETCAARICAASWSRNGLVCEEGFHPIDVLDWIRRGAPTRASRAPMSVS